MAQDNKVLEYPNGLSSIPYASFLQIEKYSYDEAQKNVAKSFNDASGAVQRSFVAGLVNGGAGFIEKSYASGKPTDETFDKAMNNIYETVQTKTLVDRPLNKQQERSGKFSDKTTLVEGGDTINLRTVESEIAKSLSKVQNNNQDVEIGSYPFFRAGKLGVSIVVRSTDKAKIDTCNNEILKFVEEQKIQIVNEV